jgi:hypothetical protein
MTYHVEHHDVEDAIVAFVGGTDALVSHVNIKVVAGDGTEDVAGAIELGRELGVRLEVGQLLVEGGVGEELIAYDE